MCFVDDDDDGGRVGERVVRWVKVTSLRVSGVFFFERRVGKLGAMDE